MMFSELQRQLPTIHIDESVKIENAWVEAHGLDGRDFNVNFLHPIADNIFILKKIVLKCLSKQGLHSTVICLLSTLSTYSWEAKLTMMLASFAIIHGESNVKGLALLKQLSYSSALQNSTLPITNYWIARSVTFFMQHILPGHLLMMGIKPQNQLIKELSSLTAKVKDIITACNPLLEEKRAEESYEA
ncbi:PREDICTED: uncharacterized protein LOC109167945 isoform X4 [Ipomoea nil]|uniref:uncharacterized protein LOC109167945 isoform X4 n=1 Tax=Ipomoea nil TaxID=35883 RepID=UPI000901DBB8|nr:PREDICTED: uncharacterized protein LOC109167945 isoform X4 [Ipomoea nil]